MAFFKAIVDGGTAGEHEAQSPDQGNSSERDADTAKNDRLGGRHKTTPQDRSLPDVHQQRHSAGGFGLGRISEESNSSMGEDGKEVRASGTKTEDTTHS
jgi:hypothetical protein